MYRNVNVELSKPNFDRKSPNLHNKKIYPETQML